LVDQSVVGEALTSALQKKPDLAQRLRDGVWQFCHADGSVISPALQFRPRGQIVGHCDRNEISWRVHQGQLKFIAGNGATTTRRCVSPGRAADGGCLELSEPCLGDATSVVYLLGELAGATQIICSSSTTRRGCIFARRAPGWFER
jgi:hypothetical protein